MADKIIPKIPMPLIIPEPVTIIQEIDPSDDNLKDLFYKRSLDFVEESFHRGPVRRNSRQIVAWSVAALAIDLLVSLSAACFLLLASVSLNNVLLMGFSSFLRENFWQFSAGFVMGVFSLNMLMLRIFLGFTLGDWAVGLRLGSLPQRLSENYGLLVLTRTVMILVTGGILLPLLSLVFGKDLAGKLTGLELTSIQ